MAEDLDAPQPTQNAHDGDEATSAAEVLEKPREADPGEIQRFVDALFRYA